MLVRILRTWNWPDLLQQTSGHKGIWNGIQFTEEPIQNADFYLVLNNLGDNVHIPSDISKVYRVVQEPPTEFTLSWHENPSYSSATFMCDPNRSGKGYIRSHPMVPWHINRDYDFLISASVPFKSNKLSWITSTKNALDGHRKRMSFLENIRHNLKELELIGTKVHHITNSEESKINYDEQTQLGFNIVDDKWEGLAPYKYSLAIENFSCPDYWTEKIADCFLAWTLPIYYGCKNIEDYFPSGSFIKIDIDDIENSVSIIKKTLDADPWESRLPAIMEARELILNRYQLFPLISKKLREDQMHGENNLVFNQPYGVENYKYLNHNENMEQQKIQDLENIVSAYQNSLCWKLTSPIRKVVDLASFKK